MGHHKEKQELDRKTVKPRVLVVGPIFPEGGGVGMVNHILLTSSLAEEYEMTVLHTGRTQAGRGKETTLAPINFYYFVRQFWQLLWILLFHRPQVLHQSLTDRIAFWKESAFMVLARLFGVRVVAHMHGCILDVELREGGPWRKRLKRVAFSIPNVVVALNEYWRTLLHEELSPRLNVVIVPNSVDPSIVEAMDQQPIPTQKEGCLILFLGSLGTRKGLPDALRAVPLVLEKVPEARFVFGGRVELGHEKQAIEDLCARSLFGGHVSFPGLVTGQEKLRLLSEASIFILPSHHENLPIAILEAMAMGLPIVTTPVAGIPETVKEGRNGLLVTPGDYQALADRIVRLAHDPGLRSSMSCANRDLARSEYSPRVFASRISDLYQELLRGRFPVQKLVGEGERLPAIHTRV